MLEFLFCFISQSASIFSLTMLLNQDIFDLATTVVSGYSNVMLQQQRKKQGQ